MQSLRSLFLLTFGDRCVQKLSKKQNAEFTQLGKNAGSIFSHL